MVKFAKNKTLSKKTINQAVVLCGGLGSRLGNITKKTPKPLIKIGGKPFLNYIIERLVRIRIKKILLLCCYKNEEFFRKYHKKIINKNTYITCIKEKKLLGTGGALINAKKINSSQNLHENYIIIDDKRIALNLNTKEDYELLGAT